MRIAVEHEGAGRDELLCEAWTWSDGGPSAPPSGAQAAGRRCVSDVDRASVRWLRFGWRMSAHGSVKQCASSIGAPSTRTPAGSSPPNQT